MTESTADTAAISKGIHYTSIPDPWALLSFTNKPAQAMTYQDDGVDGCPVMATPNSDQNQEDVREDKGLRKPTAQEDTALNRECITQNFRPY